MADSVKVSAIGWQIPVEMADKKVDFWPTRIRHVGDKISLLICKEAASDMGNKKLARSDVAGWLFFLSMYAACPLPVLRSLFLTRKGNECFPRRVDNWIIKCALMNTQVRLAHVGKIASLFADLDCFKSNWAFFLGFFLSL